MRMSIFACEGKFFPKRGERKKTKSNREHDTIYGKKKNKFHNIVEGDVFQYWYLPRFDTVVHFRYILCVLLFSSKIKTVST